MRLRRLFFGALLFCGLMQSVLAAPQVRPFNTESLTQIRAAHSGRPFVLVLWSQTCHFCMQHLGQWAALQKQAPKVPIILVNTDPLAEQATIPPLLRKLKLEKLVHYAFADDNHVPLRWGIDPAWHGELPRYYFFDKTHQSMSTSGALDKTEVADWLRQASR